MLSCQNGWGRFIGIIKKSILTVAESKREKERKKNLKPKQKERIHFSVE
jgi:hypothetical protein